MGGAYDTYGTYRGEEKNIDYFGGETCKRQRERGLDRKAKLNCVLKKQD